MAHNAGRRPGVLLDGAEVRRIRTQARGMTANVLAAKIECNVRTIVRAENGVPVSEVTAGRIALVLGVPLRDLLPRDPADVAS